MDADAPSAYPLQGQEFDSLFKFGVIHDVIEVLENHGYPKIVAGADIVRIQQALFEALHG